MKTDNKQNLQYFEANTNGLIRQYLPKGVTMARVTQGECELIAEHLNNRPRKRHGYKTPNQCFLQTSKCCTAKLNLGLVVAGKVFAALMIGNKRNLE